MSGVGELAAVFAAAKQDGRAALMPYLMGGFPDVGASEQIALAYAEAGADIIELGFPFSDPLADGPVIHAAATAALRAGTTMHDVLEVGRAAAPHIPVVAMCYANPIFARGIDRMLDLLAEAGFAGLIVPDLPLEEAPAVLDGCDARELALIPLVAPTTPPERLREIGARARGFLYTVSLTGTTGERSALSGDLAEVVRRAAERTSVPVAVGFGIATGEQAAAAAKAGADGVIVGSRMVRAAGESEDPAAAVSALVRDFLGALGAPSLG